MQAVRVLLLGGYGFFGSRLAVPLRDAAYRWVARNRYRIFGRSEQCLLPRPEEAARFLD